MAGTDGKCGESRETGWNGRLWPPPARANKIAPCKRPLSWLALAMVRGYQSTLSRLWPNVCKFHPSCSNYMLHAVTEKGLVVGGLMGTWRILRCNPFSGGGYDPPPGYEDRVREEQAARDTCSC